MNGSYQTLCTDFYNSKFKLLFITIRIWLQIYYNIIIHNKILPITTTQSIIIVCISPYANYNHKTKYALSQIIMTFTTTVYK